VGAVVLDTNAIVRAILSPAGARRKLWLLLVYGGAVQHAKQIRDELQFARDAGLGESSSAAAFLERAEAAVEHIARLLPPDAPDDLCGRSRRFLCWPSITASSTIYATSSPDRLGRKWTSPGLVDTGCVRVAGASLYSAVASPSLCAALSRVVSKLATWASWS
jgi:hypothetical protein